jgi:ABC-type transport system involved in multi-copper enzyme maturation permease subunit
VVFVAVVFFAALVFLAVAFFAGAFFATFFAGAFFAVDFLVAAFLAVVFFAALVFLAVAFFAVVFLAADLVALVFLAVVFFAAGRAAAVVFFAVLFRAAATGVLLRAASAAARSPVAAARVADSAAVAAVAGTTDNEALTRRRALRAPLTTPFNSLPGRNLAMYLSRVLTVSPVRGFRAVPALRTLRSNAPKPVMTTFSPADTDLVITSTTDSKACAATFRLPSNRSASSSINCDLFTASPKDARPGIDNPIPVAR